jgi:hypothetical protein
MAIDTQAKRMSAVGSRRLPWMRRFTPKPDGTVAVADRQSVGFVYGGMSLGLSATMTGPWANVLELHTGQRLELETGKRLELRNG